jgi:methyl-accepting chemotaxis protein
MNTDIHTLRRSFRRLSPQGDALAQRFYDTLFTRYPEVRPLFEGMQIEDQKRKLVRALALVVRHLEEPDFLRAYLQGLGAIHLAYGVKPEQYRLVAECLIAALAATAGSTWTDDERDAWEGALALISETMIAGAAALGFSSHGGHAGDLSATVRPEREQGA